jgi:hypothetical protein
VLSFRIILALITFLVRSIAASIFNYDKQTHGGSGADTGTKLREDSAHSSPAAMLEERPTNLPGSDPFSKPPIKQARIVRWPEHTVITAINLPEDLDGSAKAGLPIIL